MKTLLTFITIVLKPIDRKKKKKFGANVCVQNIQALEVKQMLSLLALGNS